MKEVLAELREIKKALQAIASSLEQKSGFDADKFYKELNRQLRESLLK